MSVYTHRNIHSGKACGVVAKSKYDGHILYRVAVEGEDRQQLWTRTAFLANHQEIRQSASPTLAGVLLALWLVWLPFVGGHVVRTSATGCGHDGWPKCEVRR